MTRHWFYQLVDWLCWCAALVCPVLSAVWWMMVWSVIYISVFLNITSGQCKKTGWKWQLESNQLSRDAQKLGIIPVRDIEGKPVFWSTQVYPGNVFPTSRCVAHSMQWNVVLKMTLANHPCGCLILIDLNICQTTISTMNSSSFLGGGLEYLFIFTPTWGHDPIWLVFLKWVGSTTNQKFSSFVLRWPSFWKIHVFLLFHPVVYGTARSWVVSFQEVFPRFFFYASMAEIGPIGM